MYSLSTYILNRIEQAMAAAEMAITGITGGRKAHKDVRRNLSNLPRHGHPLRASGRKIRRVRPLRTQRRLVTEYHAALPRDLGRGGNRK